MHTLFFIVYDSITNSVFHSQVIMPLLARKNAHPELDIHIISFERNHVEAPSIESITFHIFKRYRYLHRFALLPLAWQLRLVLKKHILYEIIARGPFAGYIAHAATRIKPCRITIQARGLVAHEYRYALGKTTMNLLEKYRFKQFHALEDYVYSLEKPYIIFEAVSPALANYMSETYATNATHIHLAQQDIPTAITVEKKQTYRSCMRNELHINQDALVYCYSGSHKPWQCPKQTIAFFKEHYALNPNALLLILTQDTQAFKNELIKAGIEPICYRVLSVPASKLMMYLAAADYGMLFREEDIINFVSRPTKALEYKAAGLTVLHNKTVAYLTNEPFEKQYHKIIKKTFMQNRT